MPTQDTSKIKERILFALRRRGPCLPVHIANEIETSILFSSAFLSELVSEKKIKISHMKVGSSPLYFLPGQEYLLERFSHHLKSKEKDAHELLKTKRFLIDSDQEPAIRVALRSIKDFAIPFKKGEKIIWKYYTEKGEAPKPTPLTPSQPQAKKIEQKFLDIKNKEESNKFLNIFEKEEEKPIKKRVLKKPNKKITASQKKNERFFNKVKEFLSEKSIIISDIEGFSKNDLVLKIFDKGHEKLLIAYNKKRITEDDLLKAYKKASENNLPYVVLSLGDLSKKLENFIEAIKKLSEINKIS